MTAVSTFRKELEDAVLERHCAHHPMTQKWARGELGRDAMMGWAVEHYHWVSNTAPANFAKMGDAPADVRQALLDNYLEERDPRNPHINIVLRFAEANGADLRRLLWVRPRKLKEAVTAVEMLTATGCPFSRAGRKRNRSAARTAASRNWSWVVSCTVTLPGCTWPFLSITSSTVVWPVTPASRRMLG